MSFDADLMVFPAPKEVVFECALRAISNTKFRLEGHDSFLGNIHLKSGVSLTSWGESINIGIVSRGPDESTVSIESGSFSQTSKNSSNISILYQVIRNEVVSELEKNPVPTFESAGSSPSGKSAIERIKELQELLIASLISADEFESRKAEILKEI